MDPAPGAGELLDRLRAEFPCREGQLKTLLGLLGQANHCCFHSLFIYGHPATGKTAVTLAILQALQIPHVFLNCVECFTPRLLFEHILASMSSLGEHGSTTENLPRCDNLSEFSRMLHQKLQQLQLHESNVYIVLDKAEYLKNLDFKILAVFTRLQELTNCRVAAVLISELVWTTFYSGTGCIEPLMLHFPQYNKAELQVILTKDFPNSYSSKFYANFVSILLSVFLPVSRDLRELQHLSSMSLDFVCIRPEKAALNFSKYCEPITKGQIREDESNKLWRNIEPHLKKAMKTIYLQEVSSLQWDKWQKEGCTMPIKDISAPVCLELPFYSKFLLIAAYLAAYNPARTDPRFFLKNHGKARKTKMKSKKEKMNNHLFGPKQFPLDRMMAIFHSIVDGHVISSAHISSQISSLVTLRLLLRVTHEDQLDAPKYKCAVTFDTICLIARTVNFDTVKYLFDFV